MINRTPECFRTQNLERQAGLQGAPLASFASRAIAFLVDGLLIVALIALPGVWSALRSPSGAPAEAGCTEVSSPHHAHRPVEP